MTRTVEHMSSFGSTVAHACAIPVSDEQLWEMSADYIAAGLAAGEQVSYFDDGSSPRVLERLADDGVDLDAPLDKGQLVLVPADLDRLRLRNPVDHARSLLDERIGTALSDGWAGVRITGALDHGLQRAGYAAIQAYDAVVDEVIHARPAAALCFYDRAHYPDDVIAAMRDAHAVEIDAPTVYDDNLLRITATGPGRARIAGEVDHSNRPQVRRLLVDHLDQALRDHTSPTDIRLDLTSLRFVDVAGAVGLVHAAEEFPSTHRLVLHGVRPRVLRVLDRCGAPFAHQLVVEPHADVRVSRAPS